MDTETAHAFSAVTDWSTEITEYNIEAFKKIAEWSEDVNKEMYDNKSMIFNLSNRVSKYRNSFRDEIRGLKKIIKGLTAALVISDVVLLAIIIFLFI